MKLLPSTTRRRFLSLTATAPFVMREALSRAAAADNPEAAQENRCIVLNEMLAPIRKAHDLPALAAGVIKKGALFALGAAGLRKNDTNVAVTAQDKFHIGSCTKAMTATLAGMLVERGKLHWSETLEELFPERAGRMDKAFRRVTLDMLLTHRSGAPANGHHYGTEQTPIIQRRLAYMDDIINQPPLSEPGSKHEYSNAGYIIAGAILERVSGVPWEELIRQKLFEPLQMKNVGFGPPSSPKSADQPWGHVRQNGKFQPRYGDNPPPLGPAGRVHCSLADYLKFADQHISNGNRLPRLLMSSTFAELHRPPAGQNYAKGWGVVKRDWAKGMALTHSGSNTMNFFVVWLAPNIDFGLAVAANAAGDGVAEACDQVAGKLVGQYAA